MFYGSIDAMKMIALAYVLPKNVTGVVINSMGFDGINIPYVVNMMFANHVPGYKKLDKIGQVIGPSPYYCSKLAAD